MPSWRTALPDNETSFDPKTLLEFVYIPVKDILEFSAISKFEYHTLYNIAYIHTIFTPLSRAFSPTSPWPSFVNPSLTPTLKLFYIQAPVAPIKLCDRETQAQIRFEADTFRLVKVGWFTALGIVSNQLFPSSNVVRPQKFFKNQF